MLTTEEVTRFISPPPSTVEGFERFIAWTLQQRAAGAYVCYAVTLEGCDTAIGIFQVRQLNANFDTAEWGFAIGSSFWGTGVFAESAELVLDFAFNTLGVGRLEARVAVPNGRGKGALHKMGAVQDGLLKKSLRRNGELLDQALYSILQRGLARLAHRPARVIRAGALTDSATMMKRPAPGAGLFVVWREIDPTSRSRAPERSLQAGPSPTDHPAVTRVLPIVR